MTEVEKSIKTLRALRQLRSESEDANVGAAISKFIAEASTRDFARLYDIVRSA